VWVRLSIARMRLPSFIWWTVSSRCFQMTSICKHWRFYSARAHSCRYNSISYDIHHFSPSLLDLLVFYLMALTVTCVVRLQPSVDVKTVMSQLMERLSKYAASSPEVIANLGQLKQSFRASVIIGASSLQNPALFQRSILFAKQSVFLWWRMVPVLSFQHLQFIGLL